jgi:sulfur relay (sulfurtransferase) DsrC/TusE family protein
MATMEEINAQGRARMLRIVKFVKDYYAKHRVPPSVRDIAEGLVAAGAARMGDYSVHQWLARAVEEGLLEQADLGERASRAILPPLASTCPTCGKPR